MPVYNGERYVRSAVESVLSQSFGDFELIISDNASTDGTREICEGLAQEDGRIRYHRNPENLGAARNYNATFEKARAPFFRWANADDLSGSELHERCLRALDQRPDAVLAYGRTVIIDEEGNRTSEYDDNLDLQQESPYERFVEFFERVGLTNVIYGLMRAEPMQRGPLMGSGRMPAGDLLFMAHLVLQGKFVALPGEMFFRRMHGSSSSRDRGDDAVQQDFWSAGRHVWVKPQWKTHKALLGYGAKARVPVTEKTRLIMYVLRRMYWHRREIGRELWPGSGRSLPPDSAAE
jgi:glycosyltransferase involved in cell wall biosynthesis